MAKNTKGFFKMEMLLLKIISESDCYGYQIVQTLDKISNGTIHIAEGTMYPILYRLLDEGLISDEKRLVGKRQTGIEISYIPRDLITVIFYYQISLNPLKTQSLSQVSFPLLFPLRYIVPPVFTNSDKGKNKGKKII